MKFGFAIPAYGAGADGAAVADLVAAGDELGYDSAWLPDHVAVPDYAAAVNLSPPFLVRPSPTACAIDCWQSSLRGGSVALLKERCHGRSGPRRTTAGRAFFEACFARTSG